MIRWEYMYIRLAGGGNNDVYRPRFANGQELQGWKNMTIHDYSNGLGQQGWELVGTNFSYSPFMVIFKRPLP